MDLVSVEHNDWLKRLWAGFLEESSKDEISVGLLTNTEMLKIVEQ